MQIIIVGCGKVGRVLTRELAEENHNITIIDLNGEIVNKTALENDVLGIQGNGTSSNILEQADIKHTDILIAVTFSDEVNLLCCFMAKRLSKCQTIARVRNPLYVAERSRFKQELGISLIINPERTAAREVEKLLQFPSAIEISSFVKGNIELIRSRITEKCPFLDMPLKDIFYKNRGEMLVCVAERGSDCCIPDGDFVIRKGDILTFITVPELAGTTFNQFGSTKDRIKNAMIIGCGELGYYIAEMLLKDGFAVKIIEHNMKRCEEINEALPKATVICGNGRDHAVLEDEELENMDSLIAATGIDEENIIISLFARTKGVPKVVTKVNHSNLNGVLSSLDMDSIVNPLELTAGVILRYVRALHNSEGSNMESLYRYCDGRVEAMEFKINPGSEITDIPLKDLHLKKNVLIAGIYRDGHMLIPTGDDMIKENDSVVINTTNHGYMNIEDIVER